MSDLLGAASNLGSGAGLLPTLRGDFDPDRPRAVSWVDYVEWLTPAWSACLASAAAGGEVVAQRFLEQHPSLLPGGAREDGLGHHGAWFDAVVSQPALVSSRARRVPDFMWLRRDTAANRPVCIEIERPDRQWYTVDGQPTAELTHAIDQIDDWRLWFRSGANAAQFMDAFVPARYRYRSLEPRFILVYGRDSEFRVGSSRHSDPERLREKRVGLDRPDLRLMTFDMLEPSYALADSVCVKGRLPRFEVVGIPATFGMGTTTSTDLLVRSGGPVAALGRAELMSDDRREYLAARWEFWRGHAVAAEVPGGPIRPREPSLLRE